MKMRGIRYTLICLALLVVSARAQYEPTWDSIDRRPVPQWFDDAKFGIFIHWGIYAVHGIDESWAFFNGKVTHEEYMRQLDGFTAKNWDPDA